MVEENVMLMRVFDVPVVAVGGCFRLPPARRVCHGYANGCGCERCDARVADSADEPAAVSVQPWELAA